MDRNVPIPDPLSSKSSSSSLETEYEDVAGAQMPEESTKNAALSEDCPVCLQPCVHPVKLPCNHIFCFLCVKGVANQSKKCALCRTEIPVEYLNNPSLVDADALLRSASTESDGDQKWYYEGRNGWWQYDERTSVELEERYKREENLFELLIAGFLYIIDLDSMVQYRRNDPTRRRKIKRDSGAIPKKGVAGLRVTVSTDREGAYGKEDSTAAGGAAAQPQSHPAGRPQNQSAIQGHSNAAAQGQRQSRRPVAAIPPAPVVPSGVPPLLSPSAMASIVQVSNPTTRSTNMRKPGAPNARQGATNSNSRSNTQNHPVPAPRRAGNPRQDVTHDIDQTNRASSAPGSVERNRVVTGQSTNRGTRQPYNVALDSPPNGYIAMHGVPSSPESGVSSPSSVVGSPPAPNNTPQSPISPNTSDDSINTDINRQMRDLNMDDRQLSRRQQALRDSHLEGEEAE